MAAAADAGCRAKVIASEGTVASAINSSTPVPAPRNIAADHRHRRLRPCRRSRSSRVHVDRVRPQRGIVEEVNGESRSRGAIQGRAWLAITQPEHQKDRRQRTENYRSYISARKRYLPRESSGVTVFLFGVAASQQMSDILIVALSGKTAETTSTGY